jgi:hypothetical protein
MFCWAMGITQLLIYMFCHQTLTGVNYSHFHHMRNLTRSERQAIEDIDEYLMGLSDSDDGVDENFGEERKNSFEDLGLKKHPNYSRENNRSDEF